MKSGKFKVKKIVESEKQKVKAENITENLKTKSKIFNFENCKRKAKVLWFHFPTLISDTHIRYVYPLVRMKTGICDTRLSFKRQRNEIPIYCSPVQSYCVYCHHFLRVLSKMDENQLLALHYLPQTSKSRNWNFWIHEIVAACERGDFQILFPFLWKIRRNSLINYFECHLILFMNFRPP